MSRLIIYAFIVITALTHVYGHPSPSIRRKAERLVARRLSTSSGSLSSERAPGISAEMASEVKSSDSPDVRVSDQLVANQIQSFKIMEKCEKSVASSHFYMVVLPNNGLQFSSGDIGPFTFQVFASVGETYIRQSDVLTSHQRWVLDPEQNPEDWGLDFVHVVAVFRDEDDIVGIASPGVNPAPGVTCVRFPFELAGTRKFKFESTVTSGVEDHVQASRDSLEKVTEPIHIQIVDGGKKVIIKRLAQGRTSNWIFVLREQLEGGNFETAKTFVNFKDFEHQFRSYVTAAVIVMHDLYLGKEIGRTEIWRPNSESQPNKEYFLIGFASYRMQTVGDDAFDHAMRGFSSSALAGIPIFRETFRVEDGHIVEPVGDDRSALAVFGSNGGSQSFQSVHSRDSIWDVSEFETAVVEVFESGFNHVVLGRTEFWHPASTKGRREYVVIQPEVAK